MIFEYVFDEEDNSEEDVSAVGVADAKKTKGRSLAHDRLSLAERLKRIIQGMIKIRRDSQSTAVRQIMSCPLGGLSGY